MTVGTEHEYSINDPAYRPVPCSDALIEELWGSIENEIPFAGVELSKELQKHVLEVKPAKPSDSIAALESALYHGLSQLYDRFSGRYQFLGLGMHPTLRLDETRVWDHDEREIFEAYDRLFGLSQHGWLNIQALQLNIPYRDGPEMVAIFNRIRALIPYLVAVTAASPFVEGSLTPRIDNRVIYYRANQRRMPAICHGVIPERIACVADYEAIQAGICSDLLRAGAEMLCREWVNSRGVIVRFSRQCLEIKAIDEQECIRSDMAVTAFILPLLRAKDLELEEEETALHALLDTAIDRGTEDLRPELLRLYAAAERSATRDERSYLPTVKRRIEEGSVGELMVREFRDTQDLPSLVASLGDCLRTNPPYFGSP